MFVLISIWLLIILANVVIGISIERLYHRLIGPDRSIKTLSPDLYFFAGFASTSIVVSALSVIIAIDEWVSFTFFGVVMVLGVLQYRVLIERFRLWSHQIGQNKLILFTFSSALLVLMIAAVFFSYQGIYAYDTGLYHTQSVNWIRNFSVVPGLGNIHGRLAFNSMFFPISALWEVRWDALLLYPLNAVVLAVVFSRLMVDTARSISERNLSFAAFYSFAATGVIVFHLHGITSLSTDVVSFFIIVYIFSKVCKVPGKYLSQGLASWVVIALIFVCATYKLSAALLILLLFPVFNSFGKTQWVGLVLLGLAAIAPFLLRNYILSGYLVYPFAAIDVFSPDWKIPIDAVIREQRVIKAWAMIPYVPFEVVLEKPVSAWLPEWWSAHNNIRKLLLVLNLIAAVIVPLLLIFKKELRSLCLIHLVAIFNGIFWFFTAPDVRFAFGFLVISPAILFLYLFKIPVFNRIPRILIGPVLILFPLMFWMRPNAESIRAALSARSRWFTPSAYDDQVGLEIHESPFFYYKPEEADRCFDAPLPCTPYEPENVEMRGAELQEGFRPTKKGRE